MNEISFVSAFLIGLAGGVHCIGMCGGIASAITFSMPNNVSKWPYIIAYNLGRVTSYVIIGSLVGFLARLSVVHSNVSFPILPLLSIGFLIMLALYIGQWWRGLIYVEKIGSILWQYLSPLSKKLLPLSHPIYAFAYGMIWGWLPCGLVYSALVWAMASGSTLDAAGIMLFFGLGTFPALIAISMGANFLIPVLQHALTRQIIAICLLSFALMLSYQYWIL